MDGTVEVMLPDSTHEVLPLQRLTKLYDGLEQIEELWGDDTSEGEDGSDIDAQEDVEVWAMDDEGRWVEDDAVDGEDWSTDEDEAMDVDGEDWASSPTVSPMQDPDALIVTDSASATPDDVSLDVHSSPPTARPRSPDVPKDATEAEDVDKAEIDDSEMHWKRFEVLPSAPVDHAFFSTPPAQTSRSFLARLSKEYRALQSSLPGNSNVAGLQRISSLTLLAESILVRAYEDRTDLLRCLIIGPENTPYQDAPFVIDWQLDSNFPQSPPIAHFLSWTNGNGRGAFCMDLYNN